MQTFNANQIRNDGYHGQGVIIAVLDTGVDASQPDLSGSVLPGADCSGLTCTTPDNGDSNPAELHGTGMAAIIAAHGHGTNVQGNVVGMVGLATRAKILPVRVLTTPNGGGGGAEIAQGIRWAVQNGAKVINLSVGSSGTSPTLNAAVDYAIQHDVVVVAAAGNIATSGTSAVEYPAAIPGVVAVSGVDSTLTFWSGSAFGPKVVLAGPGKHVATAGAGSTGYVYSDGTSPATAYVSGEAALLVGEHPDWTAGQIIRQMIATADPAKGTAQGQRTDQLGYGVMDPLKAVTSTSVPSQTTNPLCDSSCYTSASSTASSTATGGGGAAPTTTTPAKASASSSSNTGLIIGIVAGAVVLIGIVVGLVIAARRRNRPGPPPPPPAPPSYGGYGGGGGQQYQYPPRQNPQQWPPQ
jgi:subtilisin family serine protease